jgi:uncharacterized protein (DUF2141 family)
MHWTNSQALDIFRSSLVQGNPMPRRRHAAHTLFATLSFLCAQGALAQTGSTDLRIEITNVRNDHGTVLCSLFKSAQGFPGKANHAAARVTATGTGPVRICLFQHVQAQGRLAISVLHDEDSSGELNTNVLGAPTEGWGVSKNAPPSTFAPPTFDAASFEPDGKPVQIWLRY